MFNRFDRKIIPTIDEVSSYVNENLFNELINYLKVEYQPKIIFEYSNCLVPGWNIKFKKYGRSLCAIYPMEDYFICLIVIGKKEKDLFTSQLTTFTPYLQELYYTTKESMNQKWLMIEVIDSNRLDDVKRCIDIRVLAR
ncbi:hypothetical protein OKW22_001207 [Bacilli bacterium PM5-3]|nr:hypothetical protein [Bacilli bacterium PM5-3]